LNKGPILPSSKKAPSPSDSLLFGEKKEISRLEMRRRMKYDANIWKSQKGTGLDLSRTEREKLEKVVPKVYGLNISKEDLKKGIRKMHYERMGSKDPKKREVLRKEIKYLKKIGGIKDVSL
jgi:hypothetical protein